MDFRSTQVYSKVKIDIFSNFVAGGFIDRRTRNSLCRDKNKHYVISYVMVQKAMIPDACANSPRFSIGCLKWK
jgi:hypothetical protein